MLNVLKNFINSFNFKRKESNIEIEEDYINYLKDNKKFSLNTLEENLLLKIYLMNSQIFQMLALIILLKNYVNMPMFLKSMTLVLL